MLESRLKMVGIVAHIVVLVEFQKAETKLHGVVIMWWQKLPALLPTLNWVRGWKEHLDLVLYTTSGRSRCSKVR